MKFSSYILSAEFHASRQKGGGVWQGLSPALGGAGTAAAQAAVYGRKRRPPLPGRFCAFNFKTISLSAAPCYKLCAFYIPNLKIK